MAYIATLWLIEAAIITVCPLITAHKRSAAARGKWKYLMQLLRN